MDYSNQSLNKKFFSVNQAAEYLDLSADEVRKLIREKTIPAYKPLKRYYIERKDLENFITSGKETINV